MESKPTRSNAAKNSFGPDSAAPPGPAKKGGPLSGGLGLFVSAVLLATAVILVYRALFTAEPPVPTPVTFMCIETNKTFSHVLQKGEQLPVTSPYTNQRTGYPTEQCYWTKDGKRKRTPTFVVLNSSLGKPGDTLCPDCNRVVVGHNQPPPPNTKWADEQDTPPTTSTAPASRHP